MSLLEPIAWPDPVRRYKDLAVTPPAAPALGADAFEQVITDNPGNASEALASHVAAHSSLTVEEAKPVVAKALESVPAAEAAFPSAQAKAASAAVAQAAGTTVDVQLSDPVMLSPVARWRAAKLLALVVIVTLGLIYPLAVRSTTPPTSVFVALAIVAALGMICLIVVVMGYKNVTISGGKPKAGS